MSCIALILHGCGSVPTSTTSTTTTTSTKATASAMKLKFGQDVDYPPYAFKNETTGELAGFGKDIADGMTAMCDDVDIEVVETKWGDCWSGANGGSLGASLEDGTLDACMTYTHTQGVRNEYADFSYGILDTNKAAGLLALLKEGKESKVTGISDLAGKIVVDVAGWAPTADGLDYVTNKCTSEKYSSNYTLLVGPSNDESLKMVLNGTADAMFVYADQAYNYQCKNDGVKTTWNCSLWSGFGTKYAYVQTGQYGYTINGTTLALSKKGTGVPEKVNPCLAKFMETKEYHDICVKYGLAESCYPNAFFTTVDEQKMPYDLPTNEQTGDCSNGYCPCPSQETTTPLTTAMPSSIPDTTTASFDRETTTVSSSTSFMV